jgi:putative flippase GtrA
MRESISGEARRAVLLLRRLLAPDSGLLGQWVRFAIVGGATALIYLLTTTLLAFVVGLPFQVALTIGFCFAMAFHFTMQRVFVWANSDGFALPFHHQAGRYLAMAGAQYGVASATTSLLPSLLGLPIEVVYVATVLLLPIVNFLVFRHGVFHAKIPLAHPHPEGEPE